MRDYNESEAQIYFCSVLVVRLIYRVFVLVSVILLWFTEIIKNLIKIYPIQDFF